MAKAFNKNVESADFEFAALHDAVNYQRLLIKELGAYVQGRTIEIGAGIGQMTGRIRKIPGISYLQSVEPDASFCREFRKALPQQPLIEGTIASVELSGWDAIVSINVLEHIEDDQAELQAYYEHLKDSRGVLALFVPAQPELYSLMDKDFGHYRRYSRKELTRKLVQAGFKTERIRSYDFVGYFAWLAIYRVMKRRTFKPGSVKLFDRLIFPLENLIETRLCAPPIGKNLLVIARAI